MGKDAGFFQGVFDCLGAMGAIHPFDFQIDFFHFRSVSFSDVELAFDTFRPFLEEVDETLALFVADGLDVVRLGRIDRFFELIDRKEEETLFFCLETVLNQQGFVVADDVDEQSGIGLDVHHLFQLCDVFGVDIERVLDLLDFFLQVFVEEAWIFQVAVDGSIVIDVLYDIDILVGDEDVVEDDRLSFTGEYDEGVVQKQLVLLLGIEVQDLVDFLPICSSGCKTGNLRVEDTDDRNEEKDDDQCDDDDLDRHAIP